MTGEGPTGDAAAWRGFAAHLALEELGGGRYEGWCLPGRAARPFGGHLVAHSLLLAQRVSTSGKVPMSVHVHFLALGDTAMPVEYRVRSLRSGRSFEHWAVEAAQQDALLSQATVVLHHPEPSPDHGVRPRRPESPDGLPLITLTPRAGTSSTIRRGLEIRRARQWTARDRSTVPFQDAWYRCIEPLPEGLDSAVLAWCSDLELAWTVDLPYRDRVRRRSAASLDHSIHFHQPLDMSRWWLYEQESPRLSEGRGFATGRIFTGGGELAASVVQQMKLSLEFEDVPAEPPPPAQR